MLLTKGNLKRSVGRQNSRSGNTFRTIGLILSSLAGLRRFKHLEISLILKDSNPAMLSSEKEMKKKVKKSISLLIRAVC